MSEYRTEQKNALIKYMKANSHMGLTIDEISEGIASQNDGGTLGRSTVYRLIRKMVEEGSVKRFVSAESRRATYQLVECEHCEAHLHMKCTDCGRLFHMDEKLSDELLRVVSRSNDFLVNEAETVLYGKCVGCRSVDGVVNKSDKNPKKKCKVVKKTTNVIVSILLAFLLFLAPLSGCAVRENDGRFDIVCTVFPIYDWVMNIVGEDDDGISVSLIVKNGTDPHSYSPTPSDIVKISTCDMLIYVGGESDGWVSDVLGGNVNKEMVTIPLMEHMEDRCTLLEHDHGGEDGAENHENHDHSGEEGAYDEHIWLSPKNAVHACELIADKLSSLDPEGADEIRTRASGYISELRSLDGEYESAVAASGKAPLVFADRFPFGYLTEDYGIEHYEAFSGCSADSEASFETVRMLAEKLDEFSLEYVIILESTGEELAKTVISASKEKKAEILRLDSMQSISEKQLSGDISYIGIMKNNLGVIKTALG